ncbi:Smr/MutS family protein [Chloroflexota bacterium]
MARKGCESRERIGCMKETSDELDLHGLTIGEAIPLVDMFLYKSSQARLHRVWVIHGKGSGILRDAVRRYVSKHMLVRTCLTADGSRGGNGATQVELVD